jgi:hypothetical protein
MYWALLPSFGAAVFSIVVVCVLRALPRPHSSSDYGIAVTLATLACIMGICALNVFLFVYHSAHHGRRRK